MSAFRKNDRESGKYEDGIRTDKRDFTGFESCIIIKEEVQHEDCYINIRDKAESA